MKKDLSSIKLLQERLPLRITLGDEEVHPVAMNDAYYARQHICPCNDCYFGTQVIPSSNPDGEPTVVRVFANECRWRKMCISVHNPWGIPFIFQKFNPKIHKK